MALVNAPKDVSVHREEIYQRIQQEKTTGTPVKQDEPNVPVSAPAIVNNSVSTGNTTTVTVKKKRETKADKGDVDGNKE